MMIKQSIAFLDSAEKKRLYWVLLRILTGAVGEAIGLALVLPYMAFLQDASQENLIPFSSILFVTSAFLMLIVARMGLQLGVSRMITKFAYEVGESHSKRLFQRYLVMDYQQFLSKNSTSLTQICTHTMDEVSLGLLLLLQFISSLCVAVGLLIVLLLDNTLATLILAAGFTSLIIPTYGYFKKRQRQAGKERDATLGDLCKLVSEAFHCFKEIHLYNKNSFFEKQFANFARHLKTANVDSTFYPLLPGPCIEAVAMCALLGVILWCLWIQMPMQQLVSQLIFYGVIGRRLLPSIHQSVYFAMALQKLQPCMQLVHQEYTQIPERATSSSPPLTFEREVRLRNISFAYQAAQPTLQELSLSLLRHQSVALVGPSGSGKSTTAEILISLLKPSTGEFILDGGSLADLSMLRHHIGYVPQMVNLLNDSIEKNIAFGEESADLIRLHNALKMAHLDEWLSQLPFGAQTIIGERGLKISGGQRQRIGIARALYFDPKIMIFDEATASLDTITERMITENILEIAGHKTILAIAHRISTVKKFDKIYVMNQGRIVGSGTHEELLKNCTLYQGMNAI